MAAAEQSFIPAGDAPLRLGIAGCAESTHGEAWAKMLAAPDGAGLGMRPAAVWDADPGAALALAEAVGARAVPRVEDLAEGTDGILITELFPGRYLELARPFLEAGRRVFLNRPFAGSVADAREILALAECHGAGVYSASALDHTPAAEAARARLADIGKPRLFTLMGCTDHIAFYLPHCIAALASVLGPGIERVAATRLEIRADDPHLAAGPVVIGAEYGAGAPTAPGAAGSILMAGPACDWYGFRLKVIAEAGEMEEVHFEVTYVPMLRLMREFFATGAEPIPRHTILYKTAVFYAVLESARRGGAMVEVEA
jgi:hypothetical protein